MIKIFYGEERKAALEAVKAELGEGYEVFDGEGLVATDLPGIFMGATLFDAGKKRQILLKNLTENAEVWAKVGDYVKTEHNVVILEPKIDKRSAGYKSLSKLGVEFREFAPKKDPNAGLVFGILDLALRGNAVRAIQDLQKIEAENDPFMFFGLLVTQMLKKLEYARGSGARERKILKMMGETDLDMKSTQTDAWVLIKALLLRIGEA